MTLKYKYLKETAGRVMTKKVPVVSSTMSISQIKEMLTEKIADFETINYIYVLEKEKLVNVFSIKELFQKKVDFSQKRIVKVFPNTDQEKVAFLALKHNLKAIPVVEKDGTFLGAVPSDVILNILHLEQTEDLLKQAGILKTDLPLIETTKASVLSLVNSRTPWLFLGLLGGILAAKIVGLFESSLEKHFVLVAFIPLIVYMADAVGAQTQTLFIRSLALDNFSIKKYFFKEIKVGFLIALILGFFFFLFSFVFFGFLTGIILGSSLFFTIFSAQVIGVLIPWLLRSLKKDPAMGSGPFATIITDIFSLIIYFLIAGLFFNLIY